MDKNTIETVYPTQREMRVFLDSIPYARDRLMARILYETGCTISEMVGLKASDLSGKMMKLRSDPLRFAQISGKLAKALHEYVQGNGIKGSSLIFSTRQGKGISGRRARQILEESFFKVFSKKMNPHKIRYCHIAHAYRSGVLLESIAKQVGITSYRAYRIVEEAKFSPVHDYQNFLGRV
jgi:integrase/recombinase XerD